MARVLVIGDIHNPVAHPGYLAFCQDLRAKHRCDQIMFIGDVVDWHAISFHSKHPEAPGPKDEYELAKLHIGNWNRAFPVANVCIGNHDARVVRTVEEAGVPACLIRDFADAWGTKHWKWENSFTLDDVYYFHGTGTSGIHPAFNSMCKMLMSVVQGHIHSAGGIKWRANPVRRIFGMDTGCGIDDRAYAFAYGRDQKVRSILSAGVVIDGIPHHEIMAIGPGEKYHRSRFKEVEKPHASKTTVALSGGEFVSTAPGPVPRRMHGEQAEPAGSANDPAESGQRGHRGGEGKGERPGRSSQGGSGGSSSSGRPGKASVRGKHQRREKGSGAARADCDDRVRRGGGRARA